MTLAPTPYGQLAWRRCLLRDAITRAEAARILAVHVATVDRLIRHGPTLYVERDPAAVNGVAATLVQGRMWMSFQLIVPRMLSTLRLPIPGPCSIGPAW